MAGRESSRVNPKYKTRYRVSNWREYERGLRDRGDITIWLSDEAIAAWTPRPNGKRGGQPRYSDLAIETALTLRAVFHLPLRQTEGFLSSVLRMLDLELESVLTTSATAHPTRTARCSHGARRQRRSSQG